MSQATALGGLPAFERRVSDLLTVEKGALRGGVVEQLHGHKHSQVALIGCAIAARAQVRFRNAPDILDTQILSRILRANGAAVHQDAHGLILDTRELRSAVVKPSDAKLIHGSIYLLPALLTRFPLVRIGLTGGCQIGAGGGQRPMDHFRHVVEQFGGRVVIEPDGMTASVPEGGLSPAVLDIMELSDRRDLLNGPLVSGATKAAFIMAAGVPGTTIIHNPYPKPDAECLLDFLPRTGAVVERDGTRVAITTPPRASAPVVDYLLPPDFSEFMTWATVAVVHDVVIEVRGVTLVQLQSGLREELRILDEMGVVIAPQPGSVVIRPPARLRSIDIDVTSSGIYSDHQPMFALMLLRGDRECVIRDHVWTERFSYALELRKLGADLQWERESGLTIRPSCLVGSGEVLHGHDLRAAVTLLIAAMSVEGRNTVTGAAHLQRGYVSLIPTLKSMGARIIEDSDDLQ